MKKIIVTESQAKLIVTHLINEQSTGAEEKSYKLCSLSLVEKGGLFYVFNPDINELEELPKLSELTATVRGNRRNGFTIGIQPDSDFEYAKALGEYVVESGCRSKAERPGSQYVDIVVFDDIKYNQPIWAHLLYNNNRVPLLNGDLLQLLPEKDGTIIQVGKTRTDSLAFGIIPAMDAKPIEDEPKIEKTTTKPEEQTLSLDLMSPFKFDSVEFSNQDAQTKFDQFVADVVKIYKGAKLGPIDVLASASIDADSNQKLKNGSIRKDYNLSLSQKRADHIANILTQKTGIQFVGKGIGETDQFAPGKKYPEVKNTEETAPNRRLIIKMPSITFKKD